MITQIFVGVVGGTGLAITVWALVSYIQRLQRTSAALATKIIDLHREIARLEGDKINMATVFTGQTSKLESTIEALRKNVTVEIRSGATAARDNPASAGNYLRDSLRQADRLPAFVPGVVADEPVHPTATTGDSKGPK